MQHQILRNYQCYFNQKYDPWDPQPLHFGSCMAGGGEWAITGDSQALGRVKQDLLGMLPGLATSPAEPQLGWTQRA